MAQEITQAVASQEMREAMWTFTACIFLTAGLALWWSIIYWNLKIRKVVRGSEEMLGFIREQEQLQKL